MKSKTFENKPVIDAKNRLYLQVSSDDIRTAKRKDPQCCALARCIIRDKHVLSARVGLKIVLVEYDSHFERYRTNAQAARAVKEFDDKGYFIAEDFWLLPISKSQLNTGKRKGNTGTIHKSGPSGQAHIKKKKARNIFKAI